MFTVKIIRKHKQEKGNKREKRAFTSPHMLLQFLIPKYIFSRNLLYIWWCSLISHSNVCHEFLSVNKQMPTTYFNAYMMTFSQSHIQF